MKQIALSIIALTVIFYLASAFIWGGFNTLSWPVQYRFFSGMVWLIVVAIIVAYHEDIKP